MVPRPRALLAVLLPTLLLAPAALATTQDDAGSGGDAPGSPYGPWLERGIGTFTGQVLYAEGDQQDWYRLSLPCGVARITFQATSGSLWGGLYTTGLASIQNLQSAGLPQTFNDLAPGHYYLTLGEGGRTTGSAAYTVGIRELPPRNDAPDGCDAGGTAASAVEGPLGAYSGVLEPASGDGADWYRFQLGACGLVADVTALAGHAEFAIYVDDFTQPDGLRKLTGVTVSAVGTRQLLGYGHAAYYVAVSATSPAEYRVTAARMNDGGTGCDAPNAFASAVGISAGPGTGRLYYDLGDREDWYRYAHGCTTVRVSVSIAAGYGWVAIHGNDGARLDAALLGEGESITFEVVAEGFRLFVGNEDAVRSRATYGYGVTHQSTDPTGASCAYPLVMRV